MPAATLRSALPLPCATLLALLCGSAAAQSTAGASTPSAGIPAPSAIAMALPVPAGTLRLKRTSSSRRSAPLSAADLALSKVMPMGGLLSRVSAPTTWLNVPGSGDPDGRLREPSAAMSLDQVLGRNDRTLETTDTVLPGGMRFSRTKTKRTDPSPISRAGSIPQLADNGSVAAQLASATMLQLQLSSGTTLAVGKGGLASRSLGLSASSLAPRLAGVEAVVANPLVALVPEHRFASVSTPLAGAWSGRVALVRSRNCEPTCADVGLLELTHQGRRHAVSLSMASMKEQGSVHASAGATDQSPTTATTGLTLSAAWALHQEWLVAAAYSNARTTARLGAGLPGHMAANGYGLGVVKTDTWLAGDRLSFTLSAPLSARSGTLAYVDEGLASTGMVQGSSAPETHLARLTPQAREWIAETRYTTRLSADSTVTAAAALRQNPDHDANADSQMAIGVRYNRSF